jgi:hypothetical protein
MKNKLIILSIVIFSFLVSSNVFASVSNGTIDGTYHYAWGENIGFVDFKNITISDTSLSGSIYGENIGWIDLSTVTNNTSGTLGGYAWGENVGWTDFSKASIGTDGVFTGGAYSENIGWITFGTTTNKVLTDWRPESARPRRSSGGYYRPVAPKIAPTIAPTPLPNLPLIKREENVRPLNGQGGGLTTARILKLNTKGEDVKQLQIYLNNKGYTISNTGAGSINNETTFFGLKTKQALIKFQLANNLKPDGIFGPLTKALLK